MVTTAFLTALSDLCTQTVTHRSVTGTNNYGEASAVSTSNHSAHVQRVWSADRTLEQDGRAVEYKIYIPSSSLTVQVDDEMTVAGITRRVIEVDFRYDQHGQQFVVVSTGRA